MPMSQYHLQWARLASLGCFFSTAIAPISAQAAVLLTQADIQSFRNRVEILLQGGLVRPLLPQDRLGFGDAIRTNLGAQADLQLNDGTFARVGELTTFWFIPNTRDLRLSQGTVILALAHDSGNSHIETPNAITQAQNTTVVVRHVRPGNASFSAAVPSSEDAFQGTEGRTAVMVLTDHEGTAVEVSVRDGPSVSLAAGQMAIVDADNLYLFEFDRTLFQQTSPLAQGLLPDLEPSAESNVGNPTTSEEAPAQPEFTGDYWLDPQFLSPSGDATVDGGWLFPANTTETPPAATETETQTETETETQTETTDAMTAPEETGEPLHNNIQMEIELAPDADASPIVEEELPSPNQPNSESLDVPAGVIIPAIEEATPGTEPANIPSDAATPAREGN